MISDMNKLMDNYKEDLENLFNHGLNENQMKLYTIFKIFGGWIGQGLYVIDKSVPYYYREGKDKKKQFIYVFNYFKDGKQIQPALFLEKLFSYNPDSSHKESIVKIIQWRKSGNDIDTDIKGEITGEIATPFIVPINENEPELYQSVKTIIDRLRSHKEIDMLKDLKKYLNNLKKFYNIVYENGPDVKPEHFVKFYHEVVDFVDHYSKEIDEAIKDITEPPETKKEEKEDKPTPNPEPKKVNKKKEEKEILNWDKAKIDRAKFEEEWEKERAKREENEPFNPLFEAPSKEGEGIGETYGSGIISDIKNAPKKIKQLESKIDNLEQLIKDLIKKENETLPEPVKEIQKGVETKTNEFTLPKLKHVETNANKTNTDTDFKELKDILERRRQDIEYSDDEDESTDWEDNYTELTAGSLQDATDLIESLRDNYNIVLRMYINKKNLSKK